MYYYNWGLNYIFSDGHTLSRLPETQASIKAVVRCWCWVWWLGRNLDETCLFQLQDGVHKKPQPIAGSAEKPPVSSYRRIETNDLWSWTIKNNGCICACSGAGTQTDTAGAAWKMERNCVLVLKALAFPHLCFSQAVGNSCPPNPNVPGEYEQQS